MDIVVEGLGKTFHTRTGEEVRALDGVTSTFRQGEFISLVGPSGCGKSTLLNLVSGLMVPTDGRVTADGRQVTDPSVASRIGLMFQKPVLLAWRTALDNVLLPAELGADPVMASQSRDELATRARDLLAVVGLQGFEDKYPWELSGGMQQRVAIARALLLETRVMCMDEPFAALDEFTREQMHLQLLDIWQEQGFTTLFVTHNVFESVFLSDRVLVMTPRPGRVVAEVTIDLPRPRSLDTIGSAAFGENVQRVRDAMVEHWEMV